MDEVNMGLFLWNFIPERDAKLVEVLREANHAATTLGIRFRSSRRNHRKKSLKSLAIPIYL
jgi:hypothetical protein